MTFFSSIAGVTGNIGQTDYAYANAFMDNFAKRRDRLTAKGKRFGKTISLNWPYWSEGGMRLDRETLKWMESAQGLAPLSSEQGLRFFEESLASGKTQLLVARGVKDKLKKNLGLKSKTVLKRKTAKFDDPDDGELRKLLSADLSGTAASILKVEASEIDPDENISEYGFDSISFTELTNRINNKFNLALNPAEMFEHPRVSSLSDYLWKKHKNTLFNFYRSALESESNAADKKPEAGPADFSPFKSRLAASAPAISERERPKKAEIAVIGMAGRFPEADNLDEFWQNLLEGKDCVGEILPERWDWRQYQDFKESLSCKWGGFLKDADKFDAEFFSVSPWEAELMDPQQRIFLETVWETLESAGLRASDLSGGECGLFVGVSGSNYYNLIV